MPDKDAVKCGATMCCVIFILICVLLGLSFKNVGFDEMGIKYNNLAKTFDESKVYDQGKHMVTPGEIFIKFNVRMVSMDISDDCISYDGVVVRIDVRLWWKMKREELLRCILEFGDQDDAEKYLTRLVDDAIPAACSKFSANEFYKQRQALQTQIQQNLQDAVTAYEAPVVVEMLRLTAVWMPTSYATEVQRKQEAKQLIDSAIGPEREGEILDADIKLSVANIERDTTVAQAQAQAAALRDAVQLEVAGIQADFDSKAIAWSEFLNNTRMSMTEFLDGYMPANAMSVSAQCIFAKPHK